MRHIGLLGCGRIGQVHAANVAAGLEHGAQLVFCSESGISAQRLQSKFGGRVCGDLSAMLGMPEVAAVIIATPPHLHAVQAIECLQAGKSVLVEKPLCTTLAQVEQMERAAAVAAPCFAMVAENYYYKPSLQSMKELIASGRLGGLRRVRVRKMTRQLDAGWKSGYGALLEGGIHFVALISDLVDCALAAAPDSPLSPIAVEADFPSRDSADAVERHSVTGWRYDGDVTASLHYAWDVPSLLRGTFQHSYIEGDAGRILFESNGLYLHFKGSRVRHKSMRSQAGRSDGVRGNDARLSRLSGRARAQTLFRFGPGPAGPADRTGGLRLRREHRTSGGQGGERLNHTESFLKLAEAAKSSVRETTTAQVMERLNNDGDSGAFHLIDVREDHEWAAGHLPQALHLGRGIIERDIEQHFPHFDTEITLYCGGGYRSALTAQSLQKMGYVNVLSMEGGFRGWSEAGLPIVNDRATQDGTL